MRSRRYQERAELVLELERKKCHAPAVRNTKGLVEALADLLLEALALGGATKTGGVDEHQDHA
ncbi:hypothetical protein PYH37_006152 (plasmid) [Sinorhizobium numidicum]|uniref:Transposase n=1 Tax=Sinorhizobium numidicum TaxID=680248 RepID=A0ABY8D897_9HYPH|nr:hypothetical protein [Sinorhizobium numidicum]WEX79298.1 hypothetical protein PYH37_006152 [Sinorhizobium numidicum]WEX85331.1 hypothetical protein PYH38_006234 [Sinorhizobium numidicum]